MEGVTLGIDTIIFAVMAVFGVIVLVLSFLLGEVFDLLHHDVDINVGGHDVVDFGNGGDSPGPSLLNTQAILAFVTGFGAAGWILSGYFGFSPLASSGAGLAGGLLMGVPIAYLSRFMQKQSASSSFSTDELIDRQALVVLSIPESGMGRVQYEIKGSTVTAIARSKTGPVSEGSVVKIDQVIGNELYVSEVR